LSTAPPELASDVELDNDSLQAHAALGFEPFGRVQFFRKPLVPQQMTRAGAAGELT
jgi:hypothetical protein